MKIILMYLFPGWITYLIGSVWISIAGVILSIFLLLGVFLLFLLKRKRNSTTSAKPATQKKNDVNYDDIIDTIKKQNGRLRTILFAANGFHDLPVTIPVNVGIGLSQNHRCLLIDLDTKRNAVGRVFDLDSSEPGTPSPITSHLTQFKNFSVWPARNFELLKQMNLRMLLDGATKKYDYVLIYAPYLTTLPDRRQIAACTKQAIIFSGNNTPRLRQLLEQCDCNVIKEI